MAVKVADGGRRFYRRTASEKLIEDQSQCVLIAEGRSDLASTLLRTHVLESETFAYEAILNAGNLSQSA